MCLKKKCENTDIKTKVQVSWLFKIDYILIDVF